jgi:hypothetical protein
VRKLNNAERPNRSWQEIVLDAAIETNPETLAELTQELERALDERRKNILHIPNTDVPSKRKIA